MIKANHKKIPNLFFERYINRKFYKLFDKIEILNDNINKELPIFLIANHVSWWDGFWVLLINKKLWKKKIFVMMLEEQLKINKILRYSGAFSIKPNSRDAVNSLNYTAELLKNKDNIVVMYPQGIMQSIYNANFEFQKGIEFVMNKVNEHINVVFAAFFIEYFDKPKPTLYCYLKENVEIRRNFTEIQKNYNDFYTQCLNSQKSLKK